MDDRRLDLGIVENLRAESFGEPGQRTFRVLAETGSGRVSLWLEKEQLVMLGTALDDLLERALSDNDMVRSAGQPADFVGELDVQVGSLALGYDAEGAAFSLEASEFTTAFELDSIGFLARRDQLEGIRDEISAIVSQSRPRCILCGQPLT
ncbi:MAG TPA: DUF3090 family protein, partial [Chloroflexota bacterium]